ncbi:hypothetical protein ACHAWF_011419 [Thalassiosira exigua]
MDGFGSSSRLRLRRSGAPGGMLDSKTAREDDEEPASAKRRHLRPWLVLVGILSLATHLLAARAALDRGRHGRSLRSGSLVASSPPGLNGAVLAASAVGAIGHAAVVLGATRDACALAIVAGMGIDAAARAAQLVWWAWLGAIVLMDGIEAVLMGRGGESGGNFFDETVWTVCFIGVQAIPYTCHLPTQMRFLRALREVRRSSYDEAVSALIAALTNLRGNLGSGTRQRIFAFTNLGAHIVPLYLSAQLLGQQSRLVPWACISAILSFSTVGFVLVGIPKLYKHEDDTPPIGIKNGMIDCRCRACRERLKETWIHSSFTIWVPYRDGKEEIWLCRLWMLPLEELSDTLIHLAFSAE